MLNHDTGYLLSLQHATYQHYEIGNHLHYTGGFVYRVINELLFDVNNLVFPDTLHSWFCCSSITEVKKSAESFIIHNI